MSASNELPQWPLRQWIPGLPLFRAGALAVSWPQVAISSFAVVLFWTGTWAVERSFGQTQLAEIVPDFLDLGRDGKSLPDYESQWLADPLTPALEVLRLPWKSVAYPLRNLVWGERFPGHGLGKTPSVASNLLQLFWGVTLWSLFGTALCRAAAVEIATDHGEGLPQSLRFARSRWRGTLSAPAIPTTGVVILAIGLFFAAFMGRVPWIGSAALTVFSPLFLLGGVAMAGLTFLILWGWPLMVAAMAVDDCDGFGAVSRTVSFLWGRPLAALGYVILSLAIGTLLIGLAGVLLTYSLWSIARCCDGPLSGTDHGAMLLATCHVLAQGVLLTFGVSLFWSLATLNYLLLREAVDGKPFDDIGPGVENPPGGRGLPIVGIPATDLTPEQRSQILSNSEAETVAAGATP